ncbi:hypothetical protein [Tistrella mobilis]|uniref:hypothetical protein n=1 Tax=Tistrella mobilis TaxID=171437 RepID=UPI0035589AE5
MTGHSNGGPFTTVEIINNARQCLQHAAVPPAVSRPDCIMFPQHGARRWFVMRKAVVTCCFSSVCHNAYAQKESHAQRAWLN